MEVCCALRGVGKPDSDVIMADRLLNKLQASLHGGLLQQGLLHLGVQCTHLSGCFAIRAAKHELKVGWAGCVGRQCCCLSIVPTSQCASL